MSGSTPLCVPDFAIKLDGMPLRADLVRRVVEIRVETHLDLAGMFRIRLTDPEVSLVDNPPLAIGDEVEVELGYHNDLKPVLTSQVAVLEPSFPENGVPSLT